MGTAIRRESYQWIKIFPGGFRRVNKHGVYAR